MKNRIVKILIMIALVIIPTLSFNTNVVYAADIKTITLPLNIEFSNDIQYKDNRVDFQIALSYKVGSFNNAVNSLQETILMENGTTVATRSKELALTIPGTDGINYIGKFSFDFTYNSATSELTINGVPVVLGASRKIDAYVYPEYYVNAATVGIGMSPLPFSSVKAVVNPAVDYVKNFNDNIDGSITDTIVLSTSKYGTDIKTNTKLAIYVSYWQRQADGTYDKSLETKTIQVIYSAADLLNGKASYSSWNGTQLFRQLVPATVSSHTSTPVSSSV